uniref:Uncharacterized protein n=1 Tax=Ciona intestinalis TaxID=7719 RepID=H2Y149_CIOIN
MIYITINYIIVLYQHHQFLTNSITLW